MSGGVEEPLKNEVILTKVRIFKAKEKEEGVQDESQEAKASDRAQSGQWIKYYLGIRGFGLTEALAFCP